MTDKTELLRLLRLAWSADHVTAEDCKKIDAILAAPAEGVRAAGDEPVAYGIESMLKRIQVNHARGHMVFGTPNGAYDVPLYRRPQRPIVLPERKEIIMGRHGNHEDSGWNACLDEFKRLNK